MSVKKELTCVVRDRSAEGWRL